MNATLGFIVMAGALGVYGVQEIKHRDATIDHMGAEQSALHSQLEAATSQLEVVRAEAKATQDRADIVAKSLQELAEVESAERVKIAELNRQLTIADELKFEVKRKEVAETPVPAPVQPSLTIAPPPAEEVPKPMDCRAMDIAALRAEAAEWRAKAAVRQSSVGFNYDHTPKKDPHGDVQFDLAKANSLDRQADEIASQPRP